ncbi:reverse transcriptase domain-containing protein [Tanacetum coccineum]|uniref:Reverse transcriptase domain-containing protein n=1 Tax=Tanacetum coccineum TaxID=301880 RepID=A0ABQ5G9Y6_9ASTR
MLLMLQVQHSLQLLNPQPRKLLTLERLLPAPLGKNSKDTDTAHLPKIKTRPDWLKPVPEEERPATPEPDWFQMEECHLLLTNLVDLVNPEDHRVVPDVSKPLPLRGPLGQNIRVIPKYHSEDGNPARANIKQALGSYKDGDGVILFWQRQVHYRMLILDQHIQRNHESSSIYQERYEHVGPQDTRPQDGERSQDDDQRLDLADDLKKAQVHISSIDKYLNKVTRSNGHQRFFRTLMGVLSILDREDLKVIYELVMEEYKDRLPEGFDRMLWGDLMIMFNQGDTAVFWDTQQDWKLISWKLHSSSGVHTIMTSTGLVIHMFVENRYPLTKEVLSNMLELKLETEEESSMALELIKFVKQQLEEFEDSNDDDTVTSTHEDEERDSALLIFAQLAQFIGESLVAYIANLHEVFVRCLASGSVDVRIAALSGVVNFVQCLGVSDRDRFQDDKM